MNYVRKMSRTAPSVTTLKNGNVKVNWEKFRDKLRKSDAWKNAKYVEIQYSTDKDFMQKVKSKKIRKGTLNKEKAKSTLLKLKRKKTFYWSNAAETVKRLPS